MWSWKGVPKQECPDTDCVCSCLWWESCIDMDASHIFLQGILAGITLAGGRAGDGVARAEPGVRWGFPTTQWPSLPFRSGVWSQAAGEEALRVEPTHGGSVPSKYMPSPFLALGPLGPRCRREPARRPMQVICSYQPQTEAWAFSDATARVGAPVVSLPLLRQSLGCKFPLLLAASLWAHPLPPSPCCEATL